MAHDHDRTEDSRMAESQRRSDDRDRVLYDRLDQMDRSYQSLAQKVNSLQLEYGHLKDLFDARLRVIEKSQEVQLAETRALSLSIQTMFGEMDKSPLGRESLRAIGLVENKLVEELHKVNATCAEHADDLKGLKTWQTQIDSVLLILKWIGAGGLVALGMTILRLLKLLP